MFYKFLKDNTTIGFLETNRIVTSKYAVSISKSEYEFLGGTPKLKFTDKAEQIINQI